MNNITEKTTSPKTTDSKSEGANGAQTQSNENYEVELRNPWLAGFLSWLVPGWGHWYQRRYAKAAIFGFSVWTILLAGLYMGSYWVENPNADPSSRLMIARNVYCSWRPGDKRLYFIPQAAIGVVAIPAWLQARNSLSGSDVWATAFAPPRLPNESSTRPNQPTADQIADGLNSWLDVGTIFTVVAGLLNLLVIFDAIGGPVPPPVDEEENEDENADEDDKNEKTKKE